MRQLFQEKPFHLAHPWRLWKCRQTGKNIVNWVKYTGMTSLQTIYVYIVFSPRLALTRLFANHLELFLHLRAIKMIYSLTSWLRSSVRIAITSKSINLMKRSLSEPYSRMFWSGIYFSKDIVLVSWFNTAFS